MVNGTFDSVSSNHLNVSGILQAAEIRTTQPMSVSNIAVSGDLQTSVKGQPVNIDNSALVDMLATTPDGRIAIAKALNFGTGSNVFLENNYIPLLSNGYSGKGVLYGHCERPLQFCVPPLRHIVHPQHIFSTSSNSFTARQNTDMRLNTGNFLESPHAHCTCAFVTGFDLHAKLTDVTWFQVGFGQYNIANPDAFVMGPAYNADVVSIDNLVSDAQFFADNPEQLDLFDDVWVEVVEKAFLRGVKVISCSTNFAGSAGYYYSFPTSGDNFTGVNNPLSYIGSLAADHDLVFCESAGNTSYGLPYTIPSPGSGRMGISAADARNILCVGCKMVNDGTVYPAVASYTGNTITSYDNLVIDKDFVQVNTYYNPTIDRYRGTPKAGYTERVLMPYHGFGRTVDTAGPGATHRCKPDIISAQGGSHHYIYWPSELPGFKSTYSKIINGATSGTSPTIAGGVCLLREAFPLYDAHQIRECIMLSASNGDLSDADTDVGLGYGLVNLQAALEYGQARPQKAPPSLAVGNWEYSAGFLSNIAAGALDTLNVYQPFNGSNTFTPKSVQSFKCPKDTALYASNVVYQGAYDAYETAYNAYVASAPSLWTAGVLDLSPPKGLWGTSTTRDVSVDGSGPTFTVLSNRSWISVAAEDMKEIKDLMIANGIKVCTTSELLGAFSVVAESPEQLAAVVNGNAKIRHVNPVMKLTPLKNPMPV